MKVALDPRPGLSGPVGHSKPPVPIFFSEIDEILGGRGAVSDARGIPVCFGPEFLWIYSCRLPRLVKVFLKFGRSMPFLVVKHSHCTSASANNKDFDTE